MQKLLPIALISIFFLAGCESNLTGGKLQKDKQHPVASSNSKESVSVMSDKTIENKDLVFHPEAVISTSTITSESTAATISITGQKVQVSKVNYHIWRTANGSSATKILSSTNQSNHFTVLLDTRLFSSQRGEYQIEAYGVDRNGKEMLLAKSTVTFQQKVSILMYHAIDEYKGEGLPVLFVTPENFEKQMQYLKNNGYTLLTFERFGDINKVNKPIFVTFDDGMKNNMNALHILERLEDNKFKPTATAFVIAGRIDSGSYSLSSADIKEMVNSGVFSIQSHTMSHSDLRKVTNYEQELEASKEKIEQVTDKPVIALAYPIGYFNDQVVTETKKYYKYAVTIKSGQFIEKGQPNELFLMHRVYIRSTTTLPEFAALLR